LEATFPFFSAWELLIYILHVKIIIDYGN
jgi:hypothetical protein